MRDIVIGYDDSICARAALGIAIDLAKQLGDRVVIVYAYAPPQSWVGEEYKAHEAALAEMGERITSTALARVREAGVEADVALVPDKPAPALLGLATDRNARFVVVGTHGEAPLASALLGSTPHKLLHRTTLPVLVVPAT